MAFHKQIFQVIMFAALREGLARRPSCMDGKSPGGEGGSGKHQNSKRWASNNPSGVLPTPDLARPIHNLQNRIKNQYS
jgi:hypothetical protein